MNGTKAYIGLGSNMGDREAHLMEALKELQLPQAIRLSACSQIYETKPVGFTEQDHFLNMVVEVTTTLSAKKLFEQMMQVERKLGRKRDVRWGPRTIDLDLLLFGTQQINEAELIVPHPRMHERAFVLIPLQDILDLQEWPQLASGWQKISKEEAAGVKLWTSINWRNVFEPSAN